MFGGFFYVQKFLEINLVTMRTLRTFVNMKYLICLSFLFASCGGVSIEQKIKQASCINNTYYVQTKVWVRDWAGMPITLEYCEQKCVPKELTDSVAGVEYEKALPIYNKAKQCK